MSLTVGKARGERAMGQFAARYESEDACGRYATLYREAKSLRGSLNSEVLEHQAGLGGWAMVLGLLFFCWALDRSRLLKKVAGAEGTQTARDS